MPYLKYTATEFSVQDLEHGTFHGGMSAAIFRVCVWYFIQIGCLWIAREQQTEELVCKRTAEV
jgi:hypothetical protein